MATNEVEVLGALTGILYGLDRTMPNTHGHCSENESSPLLWTRIELHLGAYFYFCRHVERDCESAALLSDEGV